MTVPSPHPADPARLSASSIPSASGLVPPGPDGQPPPGTAAPEPARSYVAGILTAGLAAVCGALFTSWAGVQGTLVGAMIGATIGSSVSEVVRAPLTTLEQRIVQAGVSARRLRRDGLTKTALSSPTAAGVVLREVLGCLLTRSAAVAVAVVAVIGFTLALGGITAVEAARGEPLAAIVADAPETGTTIGHVIPNPPAALAPAPTAPAPSSSGTTGGGNVAIRQPDGSVRDPGLPADVPGRVTGGVVPASASPSPTEGVSPTAGLASAASPDASGTASPSASAAPTTDLTAASTAPDGTASTMTTTTTATPSQSVTASASAVQVVTVVVTATPTTSPGATLSATSVGGTAPPAATSTGAAPSTPSPTSTSTAAPVVIQTSTPTSTRTFTPTPTPTPTRTPTPSP